MNKNYKNNFFVVLKLSILYITLFYQALFKVSLFLHKAEEIFLKPSRHNIKPGLDQNSWCDR